MHQRIGLRLRGAYAALWEYMLWHWHHVPLDRGTLVRILIMDSFANSMLIPSQVRESLVIEAMCHYFNWTRPVSKFWKNTYLSLFSLLCLLCAAAEQVAPGQPVNVAAMIQSSLDRSAVEDWVIRHFFNIISNHPSVKNCLLGPVFWSVISFFIQQ